MTQNTVGLKESLFYSQILERDPKTKLPNVKNLLAVENIEDCPEGDPQSQCFFVAHECFGLDEENARIFALYYLLPEDDLKRLLKKKYPLEVLIEKTGLSENFLRQRLAL